ncbi:hypothetical protein AKO1_011351 [Acrasis kona]|uniref:Uncharacterized protein n=1 Tax=Acrasis kona TaxID=1008807 RepID=A0AAW2Z003_9EUKA
MKINIATYYSFLSLCAILSLFSLISHTRKLLPISAGRDNKYIEHVEYKIGVNQNQVYIAVASGANMLESKAKVAHDEWLNRFKPENNYIITTKLNSTIFSKANKWFPNAHVIQVPNSEDNYWSAQYRFFYAMQYMYRASVERNDNKVRWFYVADDDTFVIPYQFYKLMARLHSENIHLRPAIVGRCEYPTSERFYGGSGVLINTLAMKLLMENLNLCSVALDSSMPRVGHYYDIDVPKCFIEIADKLKISVQGCIPAPEMSDRMFKDKCTKKYFPSIQEQPKGLYYKKTDIDQLKSVYGPEHFDVGDTLYFERTAPLVFSKDITHLSNKQMNRTIIRVPDNPCDTDIANSISDIVDMNTDWYVIVPSSACITNSNFDESFVPTVPIVIAGSSSRVWKPNHKIPFGSGLIISNSWVKKMNLQNSDKSSRIKFVFDNISGEQIKIRDGIILQHHPLQLCENPNNFYIDGLYAVHPDRIIVHGSINNSCTNNYYEEGSQHHEMWAKKNTH